MAGYVIHLVVASEYLRKTDEVVTDKDEFIKGVIFPDTVKEKGKTHYSEKYSSDTNLYDFVEANIDNLGEDFYKGFFLHLLTDFLFYKKHYKLPPGGIATQIIHDDYDKINKYVLEKYPIDIPEEVVEFCKQKDGEPVYVKREKIDSFIEEASSYNLQELAQEILDRKDFYAVLNTDRMDPVERNSEGR